VVLPSYLDRLQAGHHDLPILLLPIINELRTAYNANIVSEATLFAPSLDVPLPELEQETSDSQPVTDESFQTFVQRMRRQWEIALLRWLQNQDKTEFLAPLHSVCETLQRRLKRTDLRRLWWIASEVIGGLLDGVTDNDVNLRRLFARLNLVLKALTQGGEEATEVQSVDAVSQALLFHIAQAKPGSVGVDTLRDRFQLQELVPDRDVLIRARGAVTGRNRELYISLGAAVRDELALVKDALDLELRTGEIVPDRREQIHEALLRLRDTLKMMGLGDSAQSIDNLMPALSTSEKDIHGPDRASRESLLMGLASKLIQVESVLEEQITTLGEPLKEEQEPSYIELPRHEQRRIRAHLLNETVNSLHQVQEGVRGHLNGEAQADYTSPMEHIAGALELIGETDTALLALKLRNALGNLLRVTRSGSTIDSEKLETVADAVAAFELYLAGCRDQQSNRERFIEILKDRLEHLPVGEITAVEKFVEPLEPMVKVSGEAPATETTKTTLPPEVDPELLAVFLEEFDTVIAMLEDQLPRWMQNRDDVPLMTDIRRGFHTLKGSGRMVGADELGDFAWHIEEMLNALLEGNIDSIDDVSVIVSLAEAMLPVMKQRLLQQPSDLTLIAIEAVSQQADRVAEGTAPDYAGLSESLPALLATLLPGRTDLEPEVSLTDAEEPDKPVTFDPVRKELSGDEDTHIEQLQALTVKDEVPGEMPEESIEEPEEHTVAEEYDLAETEPEPVDPEILGIFLEEATDILERCDSLLNTWRDKLPDLNIVRTLQRELHTFKGGSRMAGVSALGNLSHSMETLLERIAGELLPPSVSAIEVLEQGCDRLNTWTEQAGKGVIPQSGDTLKLFEQQVEALSAEALPSETVKEEPAESVPVDTIAAGPSPVETPPVEIAATETAAVEAAEEELQEIPDVVVPASEPKASEEPKEEPAGSQHIRVNADLLDSLVNSAGEISIFRSHLEQQVGYMRDNLKEFDETISRLRGQFRKLEIETETQIRSRYQPEIQDETDEFDPLEMDRFSSMQQLSRSLSESVSDLLNLQGLLEAAARKSEALLVQQSRVSKDLQEGLMQTRMVHFGTIAPRLRRITRTAAKETHKKARLQLRMTGGGDQLDRNVLERITAPLEHLLRNSIVHGIEKPGVRRKLDKPDEGELSITVSAEATEFVVRVEDDGAGMNLKAINKRAIEMGLIDEKTVPPPQQLLQFVLHSGFSTSKTVTALAGRGVGMDVVNSEIKQIGGSVDIESEEGKGTCFTIRIPFSLAVMQAIGVMAGEHRYLIPVASVSGVARILPEDFQSLLEQENPVYEFAGESYPILELEPLLGEPSTPRGDDTISILMIKAGDQRAAFPVPELLGHREVIVKPVGPQISSVPGILGGTITGDGQVVIIIDAGPLIRQALLTGARPAPAMENIDVRPQKPLALVVDDSITMRKVTTRVLEGNELEVITARDGVDATEQMQECVPDLLVLDVEMPRMDGYQVAEYVRADARLRHIPIIMITSRAGTKHRTRGKKAGANAYLSKPYKESELISEVNKLLETGAQ